MRADQVLEAFVPHISAMTKSKNFAVIGLLFNRDKHGAGNEPIKITGYNDFEDYTTSGYRTMGIYVLEEDSAFTPVTLPDIIRCALWKEQPSQSSDGMSQGHSAWDPLHITQKLAVSWAFQLRLRAFKEYWTGLSRPSAWLKRCQ